MTPETAKTQRFYTLPKTHKETLKIRPIVSGKGGIFDRIGWFLQNLLKPLLTNVAAHINNMTPETAKTQRFYTLPKTHKETLKIRPIVSGKGGIFDRIGWFLQNLLKPLLTNVAAHINNMTPETAKTQRFYTLPKTHKETLKIRPIVSGKGGIFDRIGWFLQNLLKPLLTNVAAHINNMTPETAKTQRFYTLPKTHKETLKIRPIVSGKGGIFDRIGWFLQNLLKPLLTNVAAHINNMTPETAKTQRFYTLPKTHKETLKIRPIVSGKGGIFDRIGWFLQNLLKPLLTNVAAHINNTQQLIDRLDSVPIEQLTGKIPISFDVRALYTNINIDEAILTTLEYAQKYDLECYSLELDDIKTLLELVLKNNIFRYGNQMYQQVQGLAMGGRVSGTLAILVMDRFERNYIYNQLAPTSTIYVRYIDDTNTVANNADEALQMLEYLNSKHNTIKFDLETPDTSGYLPILDLKKNLHHQIWANLKKALQERCQPRSHPTV